jgi:hypothetical protein
MAKRILGRRVSSSFSGIERQFAASNAIISAVKRLLYFMIFDITGSVYTEV